MPDLFGIDIAGTIADAMGDGLLPCTLHKVTSGTRSATDPTAGLSVVERAVPCRGILEHFRSSQIDGELVKVGDRRGLILGGTLPSGVVPEEDDYFTCESTRMRIVRIIDRDPAGASWQIQLRP